jgi:hypothetical protein
MLISKKKFMILTIIAIITSVLWIALVLTYVSGKNADSRVIIWWIGISLVSIFNFYIWAIAYLIYREKSQSDHEFHDLRRFYPGLSLVYVIVCAFRSFLPRAYVARTVMVDSWLSNVFLARLGATFAEVCFIVLIAFYLKEVSRNLGSIIGLIVANITVPAICIAQVFSWANVITTNNLFAIVEESIWGFCGFLLLIATLSLSPKVESKQRALVILLCIFITMYVIFMFTNDVPKYISRYMTDQAANKEYLSFSDGVDDLLGRWIVSYEFSAWVNEMAWLALYFSTAVWLTIYLINAPQIKGKQN